MATAWKIVDGRKGSVNTMSYLQLDYTTPSNGAAETHTATNYEIFGHITKLYRDPTSHTASWDYTFYDELANTILTNAACAADTAATERPTLVNTYFHPEVAGAIQIKIENAGNSKVGLFRVYFD